MTAASEGRTLVRPSVRPILTRTQLDEVAAYYLGKDAFVLDVETVGDHRGDPLRNDVLWISLATEGRADVIPLGHPNGELIQRKLPVLPAGLQRLQEGKTLRKNDVSRAESRKISVFSDPPEQLSPGEVFSALEPLLFSDVHTVVCHNSKFDLRSVAKYYGNQIPTSATFDTVVGEFLTNDLLQHKLSLDACVKRRLNYPMVKGIGKKVEDHAFSEVARYAYLDAKMTWLLYLNIRERIEQLGLMSLMALEMDLSKVLMSMEQTGSVMDIEELTVLKGEFEKEITKATAAAYRAAGGPFSVTSNADIQRVLFSPEGQNLTPKVFTEKKQEPSTSDEALQHHAKNPVVKQILIIREFKKLLSTYVIPYLGGEVERAYGGRVKTEIRESSLVNGRIHTTYKQHGARTGRLSSANPNLQNIPNPEKSTHGRRIRDAFIAGPGYKLVQADWSQVEPRIIASLSGDQTMVQAFLNGDDVYTAISDPLGFHRSAGKLLILSMAYGVGPDKIANGLGLSITAAKKLLQDFEKQHPQMMKHKRAVINTAAVRRPVPYSTTVLGRRRLLPELMSNDFSERSSGERRAYNHMIQGTASDAMKIALIRIHRMLPPESRLSLTVHDEVIVRAPDHEVDEAVNAVKDGMEGVVLPGITVPLLTEVKVVDRWGQAK